MPDRRPADRRLSPHFRVSEFDCRDGTPVPKHAVADYDHLANKHLERLRDRFGPVLIISGYRTPAHNQLVGGAPQSYHVVKRSRWGAAADVVCARGSPQQWYAYLDELGPGGLGLYRSHVHVDNRNGHARW